jgi:hypothetical protein
MIRIRSSLNDTLRLRGQRKANDHRQELYSRIPGWILAWSNRQRLIVQEICVHEPDVVCLQEVDSIDDLRNALEPLGCCWPPPSLPLNRLALYL